jgi:hypothetical protein
MFIVQATGVNVFPLSITSAVPYYAAVLVHVECFQPLCSGKLIQGGTVCHLGILDMAEINHEGQTG